MTHYRIKVDERENETVYWPEVKLGVLFKWVGLHTEFDEYDKDSEVCDIKSTTVLRSGVGVFSEACARKIIDFDIESNKGKKIVKRRYIYV